MRFVCILLIATVYGCSSSPSPCDYHAKPVACTASVEVIDGLLVLEGPACSKSLVTYNESGRSPIQNINGHTQIGKSNQTVSLVPNSCRAYPQQP